MLIRDNYLLFWRTTDIYSQWHPSPFTIHDEFDSPITLFENAEQYMMARKAYLFNDWETFEKIKKETDPRKIKDLGRQVNNYNDSVWVRHRYRIVVSGNYLKFSQNPELAEQLLATDGLVLVEASPYDKIWGVGMDENHPDIIDSTKWQGLNLLGKALMDVRADLRHERVLGDA